MIPGKKPSRDNAELFNNDFQNACFFVNGFDLKGVQHSYALFAFFTATDFVLQEIAIDDRDKDKKAEVLKEAEELHLCALALSTATFGQMNIQVQNTFFHPKLQKSIPV